MRLPRNTEQGFTLLEVMVSLALFAVSVLLLIQLFAGGLVSARATDDYTRTVIYAREKMTETLLEKELVEVVLSGTTEEGLRWSVEVDRSELLTENPDFRLLEIVVRVNNVGGRGDVSLASLKMVAKEK